MRPHDSPPAQRIVLPTAWRDQTSWAGRCGGRLPTFVRSQLGGSSRLDMLRTERAGQISQGAQAWHEQVGAPHDLHELWEVLEAVPDHGDLAGHAESAARVVGRNDRVRLGVQAVELRGVDPALLHELELPADVGVESDEV